MATSHFCVGLANSMMVVSGSLSTNKYEAKALHDVSLSQSGYGTWRWIGFSRSWNGLPISGGPIAA